jgi:hypothetical protein
VADALHDQDGGDWTELPADRGVCDREGLFILPAVRGIRDTQHHVVALAAAAGTGDSEQQDQDHAFNIVVF